MIADLDPPPAAGIASVVTLVFAAVLAFAAAFTLIWMFVVFLISRVGDWHKLATRYAADEREPSGQGQKCPAAWIGISRYKGVLTLTSSHDGFFLQVASVFRFGHPRLFIPWSALGERRVKRIMRWDLLVCEVGHPRLGVVALPADLFRPPT